MQKWEYTTLQVLEDKVVQVNSQQVGKGNIVSGVQGPSLHEYLNQMGREGWEAIAMSVTTSGGSAQISTNICIILKRLFQ